MEIKDLLVAPLLLIFIYFVAYRIRSWCTDKTTQKYFIPGLTVKITGALAVGLIYQFYYNGGDTFNFFENSQHIWDAFGDSIAKGMKLIFLADGEHFNDTFQYSSKMYWYKDASSYMVIRITALLGLLTLHSYAGIAILFATFGFMGMWGLFQTFYQLYPDLHKKIALAVLFMPSVFFWGSGIFKDTITLGSLGLCTYCVYKIFIEKKGVLIYAILILVCAYLIYSIKVYVLLIFFPAIVIWVSAWNLSRVRSLFLKSFALPAILVISTSISYWGIMRFGEKDSRYSIENLASTARVTAYDIAFMTGRDAGSRYYLGELDGTFTGLLALAPKAINVSLFRPYLWEIKNPLMLLSGIEALFVLFLTVKVFFRKQIFKTPRVLFKPTVLFCIVFAIIFAFAVGVSTYNFGSLSRYKIPVIPYYLVGLFIVEYYFKLNTPVKLRRKPNKITILPTQ